MASPVSDQKTKAREQLRQMKITLQRDVFFVPGWTDQCCSCWTEPNECGEDRSKDWEYTIKDWEHIITNPEKMHYLLMAEDDSTIKITRNRSDRITDVQFSEDPSYTYTNFFQFAELLKEKVRRLKQELGSCRA